MVNARDEVELTIGGRDRGGGGCLGYPDGESDAALGGQQCIFKGEGEAKNTSSREVR